MCGVDRNKLSNIKQIFEKLGIFNSYSNKFYLILSQTESLTLLSSLIKEDTKYFTL